MLHWSVSQFTDVRKYNILTYLDLLLRMVKLVLNEKDLFQMISSTHTPPSKNIKVQSTAQAQTAQYKYVYQLIITI